MTLRTMSLLAVLIANNPFSQSAIDKHVATTTQPSDIVGIVIERIAVDVVSICGRFTAGLTPVERETPDCPVMS